MSTHDTSNEPVVTSYAKAPGRTVTAAGDEENVEANSV
jgi:hypothetical protein